MSLVSVFPRAADIPAQFAHNAVITQREYLLNGELVKWLGELSPVVSPVYLRSDHSDELQQVVLGHTPLLDADTALKALDSAVKAYDLGRGAWPTMAVLERIQHVETFLGLMQQQRDEVIRLLMWEIGKTYPDAAKEFDRTCDYIRDTIEALKQQDRDASHFIIEQGSLGKIRRVPVGVALCMGPFNYPLNETFTTLIPALIMGNTVIFKPAKYGVLLIQPLLQAFMQSFPPGVINIIYGRGRETVGVLMESGKIDLFAFIGTNKGASDLKKLHPRPHRLRAVLGLDAKNPAIVLPDADLNLTAGSFYTVLATGSLGENTITPLVLADNPRRVATAAQIRLVHGSTLAGNVDIYVTASADISAASPAFSNVPFKADTGYVSLTPGNYVVTVTPTGSKTAAIGPLSLDLAGNKIYTAIARDAAGRAAPLGLIVLDDFNE